MRNVDASRRLAEFVITFPANLPPEARQHVENALADFIPVAIAGSSTTLGRQLLEAATVLGGEGDLPLIGVPRRADWITSAAFAAGSGHIVGFDDVFDVAGLHTGTMTIPVALAIAAENGIDADRVIPAIAFGAEIACRLGAAAFASAGEAGPMWHQNTVIGPFVVAAVAARLLELTVDELLHAWGIALHLAGGTSDVSNAGSSVKGIYPFLLVRAGLTAVALARSGITGSAQPVDRLLTTFYGVHADDVVDGIGEHFSFDKVSLKPWCSCRLTHPYLATAQRLIAAHDLTVDDIDSVTVHVNPVASWLCTPRDVRDAPREPTDAKFSLPYALGLLLTKGDVTLDMFNDARLPDADASAVACRVNMALAETSAGSSPFQVRGRLDIHTVAGAMHSDETASWPGSVDNTMDDSAIEAKAVDCFRFAGIADPAAAAVDLRSKLGQWSATGLCTADLYEWMCSPGLAGPASIRTKGRAS